MKILVTEPRLYKDEFLDVLKNHEVFIENILEKNISSMKDNVEILLIGLDTKLDEKTLRHFPSLKYIVTPTTGIDHIDENFCKQKNIKIVSLKGETDFLQNITATAEHTFGLILSLTRNIPAAFYSVRNYKWDRDKFVGTDLNGKTLGILGFGRYGKIMTRYAKAFNMDVIAYDPLTIEKENMKKQGVDYQSWDKIFQNSDIVSVHINYSEKTHGLIGRKEFEMMKKNAFFINTSRGKIIVEEDLLNALESKKIGGAAVDVLSTENQKNHPRVNPLVNYSKNHDNLIITPHIGGSTHESMEETVKFVLKKLLNNLKEG